MSTRREFSIPYVLNTRMELDAKMKNQNVTDWLNEAISHALSCRDIKVTQKMYPWLSPTATTCVKCQKPIDAYQQILYSSRVGALCLRCYLERYGDKGRIAHIMKEAELKENLRVLTIELKEKTEEYAFLNHKEKLDQLLNKRGEIRILNEEVLKKNDRVLNLAEDMFKNLADLSERKELKNAIEKLCEETDMLEKEREKLKLEDEALEPLVRHVEDFKKREIEQRLRKKKPLNEESTEES